MYIYDFRIRLFSFVFISSFMSIVECLPMYGIHYYEVKVSIEN